MGYGNGLGNLQQLFSTTDVDATGKSAATAKTGQSSASSFGVNSWTGAVSGDQTQLSTAAGLISQALTGSDVRYDKVSALQQQVAAGTYNVSSSDVADKTLDTLLK